MKLENICRERGLMPIWNEKEISWKARRQEIVQLLCEEEYGFMPKMHDRISWKILSEDPDFCAGKATLKKVLLTADFGKDQFSFPIYTSIPNGATKYPFFVHINFFASAPDDYIPFEEICDRGFATVFFYYEDVVADDDKRTGASDLFKEIMYRDIEKKKNHCGKLGMWAWAVSRAMDYACSLNELDLTRAAVVGHSRLGKTALLAGMLDERFSFVISNDSGCGGAALSRGKAGESLEQIATTFDYWFCENFQKYKGREEELPFDQHFLLAAMAPRKVYVGSASEDQWADPYSEFLSCYAADEVYRKLGIKGFVCDGELPRVGDKFQEGNIGYHLRSGAHYFSRVDWHSYMDYIERSKFDEISDRISNRSK